MDSHARLFADDCLLFCKIDSLHDSNKLQEDLSTLEKWESDWQMSFYPRNAPLSEWPASNGHTRYQLNGHTLEVVEGGKSTCA